MIAPRWQWLQSTQAEAPLFAALDAVMRRKRVACANKLDQLEAMQQALLGREPLDGTALTEVDVDSIFKIEKRDKSYVPQDRSWFQVQSWA